MTKEQQEIIENIKTYIHDWVSESVDEDGYERYAIDEWDKEFINAVETVLSMLKENSAEIEQKNKIIDLMAEQIKIPEPTMKIESFDIQPKTKFGMRYLNKEEVKQYFEKEVKK